MPYTNCLEVTTVDELMKIAAISNPSGHSLFPQFAAWFITVFDYASSVGGGWFLPPSIKVLMRQSYRFRDRLAVTVAGVARE